MLERNLSGDWCDSEGLVPSPYTHDTGMYMWWSVEHVGSLFGTFFVINHLLCQKHFAFCSLLPNCAFFTVICLRWRLAEVKNVLRAWQSGMCGGLGRGEDCVWGLGRVECVEGLVEVKNVLRAWQSWRIYWGLGRVEECVEGLAELNVLRAGQRWKMCWGLGNVEGCIQRSRVLSHRGVQILWVEDTCSVLFFIGHGNAWGHNV